ncbi:hypothetical protein ACJDU8_15135 [Clostridium sp. WILCCON 0269]|uniref:Uncharacterized protein n=1 Tax=Candidatus Clostridium eludens TaxID=3381663 RepID=A0ABW8SNW2_9CLOT
MKSLYFLPYWYIENKQNKKSKNLKLFILILLIVNIIFFNIYFMNKNKLSTVENKFAKYNSMEKSEHNENNTMKSFVNFYSYIYIKTDLKSVDIENKNIDIRVEGDEKQCLSLIKDIEKSNKFIVKNLNCSGSEKEKNKIWEINLFFK